MHNASTTITDRRSTVRSAISNRSKMLAGVDGRSASARRYRDLALAFADELGGEAALTAAERALVRQAAALTVQSEQMQARIVRGEAVDGDELTRLANVVTRTLTRLKRRPAARSPRPSSLRDYVAGKAASA